MNKKRILLKDIAKVDPFKAPEGYFDNLTNEIISKLPDAAQKGPIKVNLWQKVRPWVYIAAMFAGVALIIRLFVGSPTHGHNLTSSLDFEDFYQYYEDGLARFNIDETLYSADFTEDLYLE